MKKALIISSIYLATGCATTIKGKVIQNAMIGAAIGVLIGQNMEKHKTANSVLYGSLGAAIGSIGTTQYIDPDKEVDSLKSVNAELAKALAESSGSKPPMLDYKGPALSAPNKLPEKYKSLINPGEWSVYTMDEWEQIDESKMIHKDKMIQITPPTLLKKN